MIFEYTCDKEVLILEKTMSSEERIRRAEEIYNRRRERYNGNIRVSSSSVNVNSKPEYAIFKKVILQVLICLLIYLIFYLIKNSNYIFSADVLEKTKEFLSYDINFQNVYEVVSTYYNNAIKWLEEFNKNQENNELVENQLENNQQENSQAENSQQGKDEEQKNSEGKQGEQNGEQEKDEKTENENLQEESGNTAGSEDGEQTVQTSQLVGIGGGEDENHQDEVPAPQVQLSQMEIDANEIKQNYSFAIPLKGTISSRYGPRQATEIVSGNHKGIDIAVNEGTVFCAAMEGTVTEVSGEGSYGNHIYIQNGDVVTLYAHCKKIYLQKGQKVTQGMQIGEVGSTGNVTGPHLHFEIRKAGRVVNPEYVLAF